MCIKQACMIESRCMCNSFECKHEVCVCIDRVLDLRFLLGICVSRLISLPLYEGQGICLSIACNECKDLHRHQESR